MPRARSDRIFRGVDLNAERMVEVYYGVEDERALANGLALTGGAACPRVKSLQPSMAPTGAAPR